MALLVYAHLCQDGMTFVVGRWQSFEMIAEVFLNLLFCFFHEAEIGTVAHYPCDSANRKCAAVPQQIQAALAASQRLDTAFAPSQMIILFC